MADTQQIVLDARATTAHFPGVARATLGLLRGLHEIEYDAHFAVLSYNDTPHRSHPAFTDPRFERIAMGAAPLGLAQQWQLPRLARRLHADLWHAPYYIRPFVGVPQPVVTVYDVIGHVLPTALPSLRARLLFELTLRLSLRTAAHVITSSQATQRDLVQLYAVPEARISIIPLAADPQFRPQPPHLVQAMRDRWNLPLRYVLYIGSNKPHKNLETLVQAFGKLDTDATLVIAGRWDARYPAAQRLARTSQQAERIRFLHEIPDAALPALLTGAQAFVFPSRYEGFGLPPLEAMQCGTPVIAANTTALPEVVGDAGLLVAPDVAPLADAMQRVLDDAGLRERLSAQGLQRAQQFSWAATARQTVTVYRQIAARDRRRS